MRGTRPALVAIVVFAALGASGEVTLDFGKLRVARGATAAGDRFLRNSEFEKAERRFHDALAAADEYPPAHLGLGSALVGQGRFAEAIEALQQAERRYVEWQGLLQNAKMTHRRVTLDQKQQTDDLLIQARVAAALTNAAVQPVLQRVIQRLEVDSMRLELSRDRGEQIDPKVLAAIPSQVFYLQGISHLRLGQREAGVEALEVALVLDEDHALASYNLAVALFTGGRVQEAREYLDVAIAGGVEPPKQLLDDVERALAAARNGRTGQ